MASINSGKGHVWVRGYCWYCSRRYQNGYEISYCQGRTR